VRRGEVHRAAFALQTGYPAGGEAWPCEFGPELSRGLRAHKVWFMLHEHGIRRLGVAIADNCRQAAYLATRVFEEPRLQLMAPVALNIVCFRFRPPEGDEYLADRLNGEIVAELQRSGIAAPSTARLPKGLAIRVGLTNHRTIDADLDLLVEAVIACGQRRVAGAAYARPSAA
jgi:glutamate/tyrosine decarboxylase-like PLP-dependent enzyme